MVINTLVTIKDAITAFAEGHGQLQGRVIFEADDHRSAYITEENTYPLLFVAPIDVAVNRAMNVHTLRVYVYERINDDRLDVWENANDTSLILRDIRVWWNDYGVDDINIVEDPIGQFGCDKELDNLVGYFADIRFEIPSHGRCQVPVDAVPNPPIVCADATQIITDSNGTQLYVNSIPSGATETQVITDSDVKLIDTNSTMISASSVLAQGSIIITAPNAKLHIKKENDGTITNLNLLSNSDTDYIIDNNDISVNGVLKFDIHATEPLDIRLRDASNAVITPISITDSGSHATIVLPSAPIDADAQAFLTATGITDATTTYAIIFLVDNLKSKGIWNKCYGLYPLVGGTATTQKFNLKNPLNTDAAFRLEFFGGVTHDANGIQGNGVNGYLDFKIIPASHLIVNNTHACYYCTTNINEAKLDLSSQQGGDFGLYNYSSTYYTDQYNQTSGSGRVGIANADTTGFIVGSRVASNNLKLFRNGSQIGATSTGSGGVISGMTSSVFGMAGRASATTAHLFSSRKYAFFSIGEGLTVSEQLAYNNIVQAFQTILSRNV